jgi:dipeptidyl aminopeptidase/acylaminoacyl peptidase
MHLNGACIDGETRRTIVEAGGPILRRLSLSADGHAATFIASTPTHAAEVYYVAQGDESARRLPDSNPWFSEMRFAEQEEVTYDARDGLELDSVLIRPLDEMPEKRYPLILTVHGGPESHRSNGWVTR